MQKIVSLAGLLAIAVTVTQCGGPDSPATPTSTAPVLSSLVLSASSTAVGSTANGTVSLTAPASTGGATISLSTSNAAVATVQTPVTIQAGSSSATFSITGVSTGTATITASVEGSSAQSPVLTVTARAALSSISLAATSVVGGRPVSGTVTLSAPAPIGGAVVSLSAGDPIEAPANVTVPAGSVTGAFDITTRAVGGTIATTITGAYGGTSASAILFVTRPDVATASFGVSGSSGTDTCTLTAEGTALNCTFDGSSSSAPGTIVAWDWTYRVAATFATTTSGPVLTMPASDCTLLPPPPMPADTSSFALTVSLTIHDSLGNTDEATHSYVRVLPRGACGF